MLKSACAALVALSVSAAGPAFAAGCATPTDAAALKTAVIQQELMVAAFQCHEAGAYNRFVTIYQRELQSSDAALKTFFIRHDGRRGEAGYDTFKTKAANLWGLEQARHADAFCADAHALFEAMFANQGNLMSFVEIRSVNIGNICVESGPVLARTDAKPEKDMEVAQVSSVPPHSLPAIPYRREDVRPPYGRRW
jgi:hypothetical protein